MLELEVTGMTCGHCEKNVKRALESVPGVIGASVSIPEAKAWVNGDPETRALLEAVAEAGYAARILGRKVA